MARKIDDIFNECYDRIRWGESLESCLKSYPQYRHELEPLLRTTLEIGRKASYIHPRPEFKHWARVRIESAQRYPRQQATVEKSAFPGWLRHGWAIAVVAGIIVLLGTGSTMAASSKALPDEPLYPVKLATEQVQLAFAVSPTKKAEVETDLVNKRADELEAMANAGKTEQSIKAAERYDSQFVKAVQAIIDAGGVDIPPVVTTPPATTTSPATTPATSPTPTEVTQPPVTATSGNTTQTTTTPSTATPTTANQNPPSTATSTTTNQNPPSTQGQPSTTNQQPSSTTTNDNSKASKIENLKKSLDKSTSRSLAALKDAKDKASDNITKSDWQSAYDKIRDRQDSTKHDTTSPSKDKPSDRDRRDTHR
jgi:hypothetical protein